MNHIRALLIFAASICLITSCNSDCTENRNALPLAGYYSSLDPNVKKSYSDITVVGIGVPGDSLLADASGRNEVYLPFQIDSDTTQFLFTEESTGLSSIVKFVYKSTPRFVSEACGVSYLYEIKDIDVSGNLIDSVACPLGYIDNVNVENLRIYFYE